MKALLKLFRIYDIAIIALCMYMFRYFLIEPVLTYFGYSLSMPDFDFALLVASIMFITVGAGIINDYFDRKADLHNRPASVVISINIERRSAIILHSIFSAIGVLLGWYVSYRTGFFWFGLLFLFISGVFWLYSSYFKRKTLIGNIIISLLVAGIPFLVFAFEYFYAVKLTGSDLPAKIFHHLMILSLGFSIASFIAYIIHEITSDVIDFRGDYKAGAKTLPISMGKQATRIIISILLIFFISFIIFAWFIYLQNLTYIQYPWHSLFYLGVFVLLPSFVMTVLILNLYKKKHLKIFCIWIKLIMLFGILFSFIIYLNINLSI